MPGSRVTFRQGGAEAIRSVRVFVGKQAGVYEFTFDVGDVQSMNAVMSAVEPRLGRVLSKPGVYFIALTIVDTRGRESRLSNEVRVDTRGRGTDGRA